MTTNENTNKTTTLGKREQRALEILRDGGRLVTALRRDSYTGREQQAYWLAGPSGGKVRGYGFATFQALVSSGLVTRDPEVAWGSTCRREYVIVAR